MRRSIQDILDQHHKLTHVVNNAGGQFASPAGGISSKGWRSVVDLNLTGTFQVCRAAYDLWMSENGGVICNVIVPMQNGWVDLVTVLTVDVGVFTFHPSTHRSACPDSRIWLIVVLLVPV